MLPPITHTGNRANAGSPVTPPENQGGPQRALRTETATVAPAASRLSGKGGSVQQGSATSQIYASATANASASATANAQQSSGWTKQAGGPASGSSGKPTVQIFLDVDCKRLENASKIYVAGFSSQGGGHTERMLMPLAEAVSQVRKDREDRAKRAEVDEMGTAIGQERTAIVLVLPPHWENDTGNEAIKLEKYIDEYKKDANVDVITVQSDKAILGFYKENGPSDNFRILEEFANKPKRDSYKTPLFAPEKGQSVVKGQAFTHKAIMDKIGSIVDDKNKITVFEDMDPYLAKAAAKAKVPEDHIVGQSNHLMLLDADDGTYFKGKSDAFLVKANGNGHIGNVATIQFSKEINTTKPLGDSLDEMGIERKHTAVAARKEMVQMLLDRGKKHDLESEAEVPMAGCVMVSPDTPAKDIDRGFYLYLNKYTDPLGQHIRERLNGSGTPPVSSAVIEAYKKAMFVVCGAQTFNTEPDKKSPNAMHVAQAASFDGVTAAGFGGLSEMHYLISNDAYHGNLLVMPVEQQHEQETNADVLLPKALGGPHEKVDTAKEIAELKRKFDEMVSIKATTNDKLADKTMEPLYHKTMRPLFNATHLNTQKATDKAVERLTTHGGMTDDERRLMLLNWQKAEDPKAKALRRINKVMIPALVAMSKGETSVETLMTAKEKSILKETEVEELIRQLQDPKDAQALLEVEHFNSEVHEECKRFAGFLQKIQNIEDETERKAAAYKFMHEEYANEMFFVGY